MSRKTWAELHERSAQGRFSVGSDALYASAGAGSVYPVHAILYRYAETINVDTGAFERAHQIGLLASELRLPPKPGDIVRINDVSWTILAMADGGDSGAEYRVVVR